MTEAAILGSLFLTAFAAATLFPAQSELLLVTLVLKTQMSPWLLVAVASVGNILGACVNWLLGRYVETYKDSKWFPVSAQALKRAQARYHTYGRWSLLLSWVPVIGDPVTVMAGVMKERFILFLLIVSLAKTARYVFLVAAVL